MADLTSGGAPVDERSRRLLSRKQQLQLHRLRGSILEAELGIAQAEDQIERYREQIAQSNQAIEVLANEIKKQEADNG